MLSIIFKCVSMIFAISAIVTGIQAIFAPVHFSKSFGIPVGETWQEPAMPYVSLTGARQLGTGLTLVILAMRGSWMAVGTNLAVIGFVVAGTDGVFLAKAGTMQLALFHAVPGALIALLSIAYVVQGQRSK